MKTLGERLLYLIETQNISMLKFCEMHGLSYQSINPICNNRRELGMNILNDIVKIFPNLNVNWLLYGKGEINYSLKDYINKENIIQEPSEKYEIDPVEHFFITYLDRENVKNKILEIINHEKK